MMEVPVTQDRLIIELKQGDNLIGDCRYDVNPFFNHPGVPHTINSEIFNNKNEQKGSINIKITYYTA